jgi:hypothetical protein
MVAAGAQVTITVGATAWMAVGMPIFIETAGYFSVISIVSATTVRLQVQAAPANAAATTVITSGKKVITGAVMTSDSAVTDVLTTRITALEANPNGNRSWYGPTQPGNANGTLRTGDIWFDTTHGYKMYRWDGTSWYDVQKVLDLPDFGLGIRPIVKVTALPTTGYSDGDFVWLQTDGKLYRRVNGAWTRAVSGNDLVGQVDGALIVQGSVIAEKIGANAIVAEKIGANEVLTRSANIRSGLITDAHISTLSAGKITAGCIQTVNFGHTGQLFNPLYPKIIGTAASGTATVSNGLVTGITLTSAGSGFGVSPVVTLSGGGGKDATAVAVITDVGTVAYFAVTDPGSGYTSAPSVSVARAYTYDFFRSVEFGTVSGNNKIFTAGSAFSFSHITPVIAYGVGNASLRLNNAPCQNPRIDGSLMLQLQGRLIGYTGNITAYIQVNNGAYQPLAARYSADGQDAIIDSIRILQGISPNDAVKVFVAPCDGTGNITANVTCRYEVDAIFYNW